MADGTGGVADDLAPDGVLRAAINLANPVLAQGTPDAPTGVTVDGLDPKCPFCRIVAGDAPADRILETEHLVAFLDVRPLFRGHTLLVPKTHVRLLSDLPAELAVEFLTTAQRLERAVEDGLGAAGSMILVNNVISQSVPHLHLHVIPRNPKDGLRFWLGPRQKYDAEHPAGEYAAKIRAALPG